MTLCGSVSVASRNCTGEVSCRESNSFQSCAVVCTFPSTFAISTESVVRHSMFASAASSSSCAGDMRGEWNAPPTGSGVARFHPSSLLRDIKSSRPAREPLTTICPVPLMFAIQTFSRVFRFSNAPSSPPMSATIDPSVVVAQRSIAAPRTPMSFAPSSIERSPEATSAENSPRL